MSATPEPPLPYGWVRQFHQESGHPFYVDTKANPPRSIWVHPYEDEQYLSEHPDAREKTGSKYSPPSTPIPQSPSTGSPKRGFLGKIKDKAIGTREEREEEKRRAAMLQEQRYRQRMAQAAYAPQFGGTQQMYGQPQYGYGQPQGMGMGGMGGMGGMSGMGGGRRGGMGGMGLPLLGGLAGGLLLGDMMDGDGGGGGYDGGGGGFDDGGDGGGGGDF